MKWMKKTLATVLVLAAAVQSTPVLAKGWAKNDSGWVYLDEQGNPKTGWLKDGSHWYYLNLDGTMKTGWLQAGSSWYYFQSSGEMVTGWKKIGTNWYYFVSSGEMTTGWKKISSSWYYFLSSGEMATGWKKVGTTWYYFETSGEMAVNTVVDGYTLGSDGSMSKPASSESTTTVQKPESQQPVSQPEGITHTYLLNTNTGCFHGSSSCRAVRQMKDENKAYVTDTYANMKARGFWPCSICLN